MRTYLVSRSNEAMPLPLNRTHLFHDHLILPTPTLKTFRAKLN